MDSSENPRISKPVQKKSAFIKFEDQINNKVVEEMNVIGNRLITEKRIWNLSDMTKDDEAIDQIMKYPCTVGRIDNLNIVKSVHADIDIDICKSATVRRRQTERGENTPKDVKEYPFKDLFKEFGDLTMETHGEANYDVSGIVNSKRDFGKTCDEFGNR